MKSYPSLPRIDDAPAPLLDGGHLWIQELIDGAHLRFRLDGSGVIRAGDRTRVFDSEEIPVTYRCAVRHVRERLDREALRDAVDDVESVVFFGEATVQRAIDYDWARMPPFLGFDVWIDEGERFLSVDRVEQIYRGLGLSPVNTFRKEVRAVDFAPGSYEIPDSAWYDGPAAGVVLRNKTGQRAKLVGPDDSDASDHDDRDDREESGPGDCDDGGFQPADDSPDALAERHATEERFERVVRDLEDHDRPVTVDAVYERVFEAIVREEHRSLFDRGRAPDVRAFRGAIADRTRRYVNDGR